MEALIIILLLFFAIGIILAVTTKKAGKKEAPKYKSGTGKVLMHKQGWTYTDLSCNGGASHSAMNIVENHKWLSDYANVTFARTLGVTKTKDFIRDGVDEYTYMLECW